MSCRQRIRIAALAAACGVAMAGCVAPPRAAQPPPAPVPASTEVYFYPTAGQSESQQDRDRYECYLWAVKQTGYDPGQRQLAPHQRVVVEPRPPPGVGTAVGAVTGAAIGAAVSPPRDAAGGAVVGAVAGAVLGAASDASRQAQAEDVQRRYDRVDRARYAEAERRAQEYRRAMQACLEGRGYAVN
jgi:hypothetical protein